MAQIESLDLIMTHRLFERLEPNVASGSYLFFKTKKT